MKDKIQISAAWLTIIKILLPLIFAGIGGIFWLLVDLRSNQNIILHTQETMQKTLDKHDGAITDIRIQGGRYDELFDDFLTKKSNEK